ncbi:hypothetical protein GGR52DRAFT_305316 [Hypoxylon sp. FL1284]|nr:hypothetical protein GGR52DRAFT_305316 [Hypoxylon sp. FL1284]
MLAIVILMGLLGLAQASLKTPRTGIPAAASPSSSLSTATASTPALSSATATAIPACDMPPNHFNGSTPHHTRTGTGRFPHPFETRSGVAQASSGRGRGRGRGGDVGTGVARIPPTATAEPAVVTPSPELPPGGNFHEIGAKIVQTTYWSCVTFPLETHCGWHEPILDASTGAAAQCDGSAGRNAAVRAGVVAGVVAGGLMLGM